MIMKKLTKKYWIIIGIVGTILLAALFGGSGSNTETPNNSTPPITEEIPETNIPSTEETPVDTRLAWEINIQTSFPKTDCQLIKDTIPGYTDNIVVEKIAEAAATITTEYGETFYVAYYVAGDKEGEIAAIDTAESNTKLRTRLYPQKEIEYTETSIDELTAAVLEDWETGSSSNSREWTYKYIELEMSISSLMTTRLDKDTIKYHDGTACSYAFMSQHYDVYTKMVELDLRPYDKVKVKLQIASFDGSSGIIIGLIHDIELVVESN
jgi:hypothetical protein